MNDDRVQSSIAFAVAVDAVIPGQSIGVGSGVLIGPSHVLTAGHVVEGGGSTATGARVTLDANVPSLPTRFPQSPIPSNQLNVTTAPLFPENYDTTGAPNDDIALLTLATPITAPGDVPGLVVFLDPDDIVGRAIQTAGYPGGSVSPDPSAQTQYSASGTVYSTTGGGLFGTDVRITYSESVDTQGGQSGSGVWLTGGLFGETNTLVAAVHTRGVNDVTQIADGTQSGNLITKAIYDDITAQMEADSGTADAKDLPENVIVGSNPNLFSFLTGAGDDYIVGSYRFERIIGQGGSDRMLGGDGDDRLEGGDDVDQALFSGLFSEYDFSITDAANPAFEFVHARGSMADGTDTTKDTEFAVFEFEDADKPGDTGYGEDDDGNVFFVPLQVDPDDNTKLKDGPLLDPEIANVDVTDTDGEAIGTLSVEQPAFMFDGDIDFTLNLGAEENILFNFAYIVDSSGSMVGQPIADAKAAYQALTEALIDQGVADRSNFAVVDFDSTARLFPNLDAQGAISAVNSLPAGGGTSFGPALNVAEGWFESLSNVNRATNIAYFLSDGFGSGASPSLQLVNEGQPDESVVDVRAFGIGAGADLNGLNTIDSNSAILLASSSDLIEAFSVSGVDRDSIDRIDITVNGTLVQSIAPSELVDSQLGLSFEGSIDNLEVTRTAVNVIDYEVFFNDGTPSAKLSTNVTTGQEEVRQDTSDGTVEVVTFSVNQSDFVNGAAQTVNVNANDLDNNIELLGDGNLARGFGGNDTFVIAGGNNVIDGGDGTDVAVFETALAAAGPLSKSGGVATVGTNSLFDVEFLSFTDALIETDTLTAVPVVTLVSDAIVVNESDAGSKAAEFTLMLDTTAASDVVIDFATRNGSALAGSDFVATLGSVTIAAGTTEATVEIALLADSAVEPNENFFVDFLAQGDAQFRGNLRETTGGVLIEDDDANIAFSLSGDDFAFSEGSGGIANTRTILVERSGDLSGEDTVEYAVSGHGTNPTDSADFLSPLSGSVTFISGEATKSIDIVVNGDNSQEEDETILVTLTSTSGGSNIATPEVLLTILNDDTLNEIIGTVGRDRLNGTPEADLIRGLAGNDKLNGKDGDDVLLGGDGNDRVRGGKGSDEIEGGNGKDKLWGGRGDDAISGGSGRDYLSGGSGDDMIFGNEGSDILWGGNGNDLLSGGSGYDKLIGGRGGDTYLFEQETAFDGRDLVVGFNPWKGDKIDISDLLEDFDPISDSIGDFVNLSRQCFGKKTLSVDVNGGGDDFVEVATIYAFNRMDLQDLIDTESLVVA